MRAKPRAKHTPQQSTSGPTTAMCDSTVLIIRRHSLKVRSSQIKELRTRRVSTHEYQCRLLYVDRQLARTRESRTASVSIRMKAGCAHQSQPAFQIRGERKASQLMYCNSGHAISIVMRGFRRWHRYFKTLCCFPAQKRTRTHPQHSVTRKHHREVRLSSRLFRHNPISKLILSPSAITHDAKTALAGQIARACAVFCVDEIVVFDDGQAPTRAPESGGYTAFADPNYFLFHLLSYLETPPHLRRALFPMHPDLRTAGALPSLDMPHHLRGEEWCAFREGVTKDRVRSPGEGTLVETGLPRKVVVPVELEVGMRITVQLPETDPAGGGGEVLQAEAVGPDAPRTQKGYYWGYAVRQAGSLGEVFTECPFDGGYDVSVGTSERGVSLREVLDHDKAAYITPTWQHLLVVFGGVAGLEAALSADTKLREAGVGRAQELFDRWVNAVPGQGSRTIRTEEAVWVVLTGLRSVVDARADL
nr:putative methyltransferase c9orf114 [Quercus suber]